MGEGAVLFCTRTEVYFGLNQVGHLIWRALADEPESLESVVDAMAEAFPDPPREELRNDLMEFLEAMQEGELLVAGDVSPGTS